MSKLNKLPVLVAYPYLIDSMAEVLVKHENRCELLLDSGAFTAMNTGKPIDLDNYINFLRTTSLKIWRYFVLDVVGDAVKSKENYYAMLDAGLNPIPIITRGADDKEIEEYYETSDLIGIGGLNMPNKKIFIRAFMKKAKGRKVHWLGHTQMPMLKRYKPYSVDSSGYTAGARYAQVPIYLGGGREKTIKRKTFAKDCTPQIKRLIERLGFNPEAFLKEKSWAGGASLALELSAANAVARTLDIRQHLGTRNFLASAVPAQTEILFQQHRKQIKQIKHETSRNL
tara:strand:+ start:2324 stop:3175 length:852 start_codon:yes stop_codon:yes gene_type:complete